jgi:hypothetical protein
MNETLEKGWVAGFLRNRGPGTKKTFRHQYRKAVVVAFNRAYRKMVFSPKLCVMLKILSSEYYPYACGKISRMP